MASYSRKRKRHGFRSTNPVEACAVVSACLQAYQQLGESRWRKEAWSAFNWFLGDNDLQIALYDHRTGGCRDGLHPDRANENQGAESTLSFLMALLDIYAKWKKADVTESNSPMSILAEKSLDRPVMNKYETLFSPASPDNPIPNRKDWPYSMNSVF